MMTRFFRGVLAAFLIASAAFTPSQGAAGVSYDSAGPNPDGQTDIIWQRADPAATLHYWFVRPNTSAGDLKRATVWHIDDTYLSPLRPPTNWSMVATADFNLDGQTDLFWRHLTTGSNMVWFMRGVDRLSDPAPELLVASRATNYHVVGAGDFNQDGRPDILWSDDKNSPHSVWYLGGTNGVELQDTAPLVTNPSTPGWRAIAVADFDNDNQADILWRNMSPASNGAIDGRLAIWNLDGVKLREAHQLPEPWVVTDPQVLPVAAGQFNNVGETDILWRYPDGGTYIWRMRGTKVLTTGRLQPRYPQDLHTGPEWKFAGLTGRTNQMMLTANATTTPPAVRLSWLHGAPRVSIQRKRAGDSSFVTLVKEGYTRKYFTDTNVTVGERYEYKVNNEAIAVGVEAALQASDEYRGKVVLVVESSLDRAIARDIVKLKDTLVADGWRVIQHTVTTSTPPPAIRGFIQKAHAADPTHVKAAILLGHVPVPYSGRSAPDNHQLIARPADTYYGDMDGTWTDTLSDYYHKSGDGKFDQNLVPGNGLEVAVGRIDFTGLNDVGDATAFTQLYIERNAKYRLKQLPTQLKEQVVVGFQPDSPARAYRDAIRMAGSLYGKELGRVVEGDPLAQTTSAEWGLHVGYGSDNQVAFGGGMFFSWNWRDATSPKLHFLALRGSFMMHFDRPNNIMRAFLTSEYGLAVLWYSVFWPNGDGEGSVPLRFGRMGLGETVGSGFVRTINESAGGEGSDPLLTGNTYFALLGDPTLRLGIIKPPAALEALEDNSNVRLSWQGSAEAGATYLIERTPTAAYENAEWTKLGTTNATTWVDSNAPSGAKSYRVRAQRILNTGSGSYTTLSQGLLKTVK